MKVYIVWDPCAPAILFSTARKDIAEQIVAVFDYLGLKIIEQNLIGDNV